MQLDAAEAVVSRREVCQASDKAPHLLMDGASSTPAFNWEVDCHRPAFLDPYSKHSLSVPVLEEEPHRKREMSARLCGYQSSGNYGRFKWIGGVLGGK